jgi:hypothetical protein
MLIEYPFDKDKWLTCVAIAEEYFSTEEVKEKARIIYLKSSLLPIWKPREVAEGLAWQ